MCQVLRCNLGLPDCCVDLDRKRIESALKRRGDGVQCRERGGEGGTEQAVVSSGEEQGDAQAEVGDAVAEAFGDAFDEAVQAQPAQLIGDGALGDRGRVGARQGREMPAQIGRPEAFGELAEQDEGVQQGMDALVSKAQTGGTLTTGGDRLVDGLEGVLSEDAVVAQAFGFEEPAIGGKADLAQLGEIVETLADPEVIGVVDGGLRAQGAVFLVILLDARVLVMDVQRRGHISGNDAGAKPLPGAAFARHPAIEDELDLLGTAKVEIFTDHLFKEQAADDHRTGAMEGRTQVAPCGLG